MTDTTEKAAAKTAAGAAPVAPVPAPAARRHRVWRGITPWLFLLAPSPS